MKDIPVCFEGIATENRFPVETNAFFIPERLKEIDPRLFVMFNRDTQKYEVHVTGQQGTTLGCELPFPDLDYRAIHHVREFSSSRIRIVASEIQKHNDRLEQTAIDGAFNRAGYKMKTAIDWAEHHPSNQMPPEELIKE